ncbi:uncharacterized protein PgNI_07145 [Pyricularia grisea]|uniref:Uncharacterized protein n=1 Tax=Pyricularia grisea TaxID=148305 RepID=A0A6P8B2N4_PYRGI|nr:uncharacterized protein PgNI_07145 [Pyricularia grisea]TLD09121.1 hypothetical protein PgNI_07145 [Pyricularia grisea]
MALVILEGAMGWCGFMRTMATSAGCLRDTLYTVTLRKIKTISNTITGTDIMLVMDPPEYGTHGAGHWGEGYSGPPGKFTHEHGEQRGEDSCNIM